MLRSPSVPPYLRWFIPSPKTFFPSPRSKRHLQTSTVRQNRRPRPFPTPHPKKKKITLESHHLHPLPPSSVSLPSSPPRPSPPPRPTNHIPHIATSSLISHTLTSLPPTGSTSTYLQSSIKRSNPSTRTCRRRGHGRGRIPGPGPVTGRGSGNVVLVPPGLGDIDGRGTASTIGGPRVRSGGRGMNGVDRIDGIDVGSRGVSLIGTARWWWNR